MNMLHLSLFPATGPACYSWLPDTACPTPDLSAVHRREKLADGQAHLPGRMYWMNDKYLKLVPDDSE